MLYDLTVVDTFDIVTIQLYESYTHMLYNVTAAPSAALQTSSEYLTAWVPRVLQGWEVDFSSDPSFHYSSTKVGVRNTTLCIGIANGWADNKKNILIMPDQLASAYAALAASGAGAPRGFAYWAIDNEGQVPYGHTQPLYMAAGLNSFLHTRP